LRWLGFEVVPMAVAAVPPLPECWVVPAGDDSSAVPDSASEASEGICTLRRGRFATDFMDELVLVREGGMMPSEDMVLERPGRGVERAMGAWWRRGGFASPESSSLMSGRGGSGDRPKKCDARTEPLASIGVKMLRDLEARCLG
jgi:hypothetical protein